MGPNHLVTNTAPSTKNLSSLVNPVAQKLLVITSNSQTMHSLTMHTRKTRPMFSVTKLS